MRIQKAALIIVISAVVAFCLGFANAEARVFVGGGVVLGGPHYYYPPYYSYYPPPYPPYPTYYANGAYPVPPPTADERYYSDNEGDYCREYHHTVFINGARRQVYGHACRQPDGSWHIVD